MLQAGNTGTDRIGNGPCQEVCGYKRENYYKHYNQNGQQDALVQCSFQMIFLLEVPIVIDGNFEGVVYGGISADFLTNIVANLAMGNDGVAYILDQRGNVIGHRESSVVIEGSNMIEAAKSDPSVADVAAVNQRMVQGETGFGSYNFYGDNIVTIKSSAFRHS